MRHKFNAKQTIVDEIKFPSKAEANRYRELKLLEKAKEILFFMRQPVMDLPGGVTYKPDFVIFWADGNCTIEDVKGFKTKDFIMKKKIVESLYPVEIEVVK